MALYYLSLGYFIKILTGLDDLAITIPLVSDLGFDKTIGRKWTFGIGIFLAASVAMAITFFFSSLIKNFQYSRELTFVLLFGLATAIYFELFDNNTEKKTKKSLRKVKELDVGGTLFKIFSVSFVTFLVSSSDDMIAYLPLFLNGIANIWYAVAGISLAVLTEILIVVFFAEKVNNLTHSKEITSVVLFVLGILVLGGVI